MHSTLKMAVAAALALAAAPAFAADAPLQVSYPSDASLDCAGIAAELVRVDGVVAQTNQKIAGADGSARGAGLANTVAVEGLARSGMLARAPGIGMFANQIGGMARQRAEKVKAEAAETIRVAETRKALLSGIWSGKSCSAPSAAAAPTQTPAG